MIEFTVYGCPVAQPRQRHAIRRIGPKAFVANYTPAKSPVNAWKYAVGMEAQKARQYYELVGLWSGPVRMTIDVYFPRPQKFMRAKDPDGAILCVAKPDVDNLFKSVADALSGIIFTDDKLVCHSEVRKFYHEKNGAPRAEIKMEMISE